MRLAFFEQREPSPGCPARGPHRLPGRPQMPIVPKSDPIREMRIPKPAGTFTNLQGAVIGSAYTQRSS